MMLEEIEHELIIDEDYTCHGILNQNTEYVTFCGPRHLAKLFATQLNKNYKDIRPEETLEIRVAFFPTILNDKKILVPKFRYDIQYALEKTIRDMHHFMKQKITEDMTIFDNGARFATISHYTVYVKGYE